jgi:hypothetical protein
MMFWQSVRPINAADIDDDITRRQQNVNAPKWECRSYENALLRMLSHVSHL